MREEINFSRSKEFKTFLAGFDTLEEAQHLIHGVFIELHPMWRAILDADRAIGAGYPLIGPPYFMGEPYFALVTGSYDRSQRPHDWVKHTQRFEKQEHPYLVKIYVVPARRSTAHLRGLIEDYAARQPFFTIVVDAPVPTLSARVRAAIDIQATVPGTLGGYLKDQTGHVWGVTCGHVAQKANSKIDLIDASGNKKTNAGTVTHTNFSSLRQIGKNDKCRNVQDSSNVNVDLALIELDQKLQPENHVRGVGIIDEIFDEHELGSGDSVTLRGAITGPRDYDIQGYGVVQKVHTYTKNGYICFSHVFDLATAATSRLQRVAAPLPVQGDSGAWVVADGHTDHALYGMLFAIEASRGVAAFAESLVSWAENNWGLQLSIL